MEFVNFLIANKLKEKGFNIPFYFFYRSDDKLIHHAMVGKPLIYCNEIDDEVICAPTISQVLKWLRKEKKMHMEIFLYDRKYSYFVKSITQICEDDLFHKCLNDATTDEEYATYEQAALAGIEYVLDKLI